MGIVKHKRTVDSNVSCTSMKVHAHFLRLKRCLAATSRTCRIDDRPSLARIPECSRDDESCKYENDNTSIFYSSFVFSVVNSFSLHFIIFSSWFDDSIWLLHGSAFKLNTFLNCATVRLTLEQATVARVKNPFNRKKLLAEPGPCEGTG